MLSLFLLSSLGLAEELKVDTRTALIGMFFPSNAESVKQAERIPEILLDHFEKTKGIRAYSLDQMSNIYENTAEVYMLSCPQDEFSGCTMVVADNSKIPYAVTGRVTALESGMRVEVHFLDTVASREQLVVSLDVSEQGEAQFAETVARSLLSVMKGEISQGDDVREEEKRREELDIGAVGELNDFTQEQGGAESIGERIELEIEEKGLTKQDIYLMMEEEGMKEWDRLGMLPMEYLKYYNSGVALGEWKKRSKGRKGSIVIRGSAGTGLYPVGGEYYGRIFKNKSLENEEIYTWQTMTHQWTTPLGKLYGGIGVAPNFDLGVFTGVGISKFWVDYHSISETNYSKAQGAQDYSNQSAFFGFEGVWVPRMLVMDVFKPLAGMGMTYFQGKAADDFLEDFPPDGIPALPAMNALTFDLTVGGEMRVSHVLDLYIHLPLAITVWSDETPTYIQGGGRLEANERTDYAASELGLLGGGFMIGVQTRVPLKKEKQSSLDLYE